MAMGISGSIGIFLIIWFFYDYPTVKEIMNILYQVIHRTYIIGKFSVAVRESIIHFLPKTIRTTV